MCWVNNLSSAVNKRILEQGVRTALRHHKSIRAPQGHHHNKMILSLEKYKRYAMNIIFAGSMLKEISQSIERG